MEFTMFIIPMTMILVQLVKNFELVQEKKILPVIATFIGGVLGFGFGMYYGGDYFQLVVQGVIYGATASGVYDITELGRKE